MLEAFVKLGLGEQLKAKTQQSPSGAQVADILAKGEADIGFQQISELLHAPGIRYLGPVPADLQNYTIYAAALHARAPNAEAAKALLSTLRAPATQALIRASGMEPL
jgi:molybdate transport system substrate-binding protein